MHVRARAFDWARRRILAPAVPSHGVVHPGAVLAGPWRSKDDGQVRAGAHRVQRAPRLLEEQRRVQLVQRFWQRRAVPCPPTRGAPCCFCFPHCWCARDFTCCHRGERVLFVVCCAVVCLAVLWCGVVYCTVLCCAVLCCAVLCCAVLCCAVLCCAVQRGAALVQLSDADQVESCIKLLSGAIVRGRRITIEYSKHASIDGPV